MADLALYIGATNRQLKANEDCSVVEFLAKSRLHTSETSLLRCFAMYSLRFRLHLGLPVLGSPWADVLTVP